MQILATVLASYTLFRQVLEAVLASYTLLMHILLTVLASHTLSMQVIETVLARDTCSMLRRPLVCQTSHVSMYIRETHRVTDSDQSQPVSVKPL